MWTTTSVDDENLSNLESGAPRPCRPGTALLLLLALGWTAGRVEAGNGSFIGGVFNFCVSVRFEATAEQLEQIRTAFEMASQVIADATDGQHRFGTITLANNRQAGDAAEYWIASGTGRAGATMGKYGIRGEHVNLFYDVDIAGGARFSFASCPGAGPMGAEGPAHVIAHEHAHHAYGVLDEYAGMDRFDGLDGAAECAPLPDAPGLSFCLMDSFGCRGGRADGSGYTLNEFCTAQNHDPDGDSWQATNLGLSCWEAIASHPDRPARLRTPLPSDPPPALRPVAFKEATSDLRVALVVDRSGSMAAERRLELAKAAACLFIELLDEDTSLAIAAFDGAASSPVEFALANLESEEVKATAKQRINSLTPGSGTNIGGGLLAGLQQLRGRVPRSCNETIVLLTDGDHRDGTPPDDVLPALRGEAVTVICIGVGTSISPAGESTCQRIATQTGGKFHRFRDATELLPLGNSLQAEVEEGGGVVVQTPLLVDSGSQVQVPALLEVGVESAVFTLTIPNSADGVTLSLRTPSGAIITESTAAADPRIDFLRESNSLSFEIESPEPGDWTMVVAAASATGELTAIATTRHEGVEFNATVVDNEVTVEEVLTVHAGAAFGGQRVIGGVVEGVVVRPDGSEVRILLHDDGAPGGGDLMPLDGEYSATFAGYVGDGTYTFRLTVLGEGARTYGGEAFFDGVPSNEIPVPRFTRRTSATAVVRGATSREPFVRGDCNGDGHRGDVADAVWILYSLFRGGPTGRCPAACDANNDGRLELSDALFLIRYQFHGGVPPASPFPECQMVPSAYCEEYRSCR